MKLFITSSPFVEGADDPLMDPRNGLIRRLKQALPPYCRCLYICSSPDRRDLNCTFGADIFQIFAQEGMPFSHYAVLDGENFYEARKLVGESDLIVLAGGHVPTQNAFFHKIHLPELLRDYDGVVMGISAGSMNMAEVVYAQPEEPGESAPDYQRFIPGLGITDINILPHYQKVKDYRVDGLHLFYDITFPDSMGRCFFALPDGSYIYQDEEKQLLCGKGYSVIDGVMELINDNEETLDLNEEDHEDRD